METMDDTEDQNGYEKEGNKYFEEEDGNFDVSNFIDPEEGEGKEKDGFPDERATVSRKVEEDEIDPDELEETVNKLEEVFSCLPRVLIQRILCRDDVKGNIEIASQRLQEFQNMDDPQDMFKSPMTSKSPAAQQHPVNDGDLVGKTGPQSFDEGKKKKRNRRKSKKNVNDNGSQMEQMEVEEQLQWRRNSLDRNQTDQRDGNQVYCGQESRRGGGFRGKPSGGKKGGTRDELRGGPRGGFGKGQRCHQEYRGDVFQDDLRFRYDDDNFMPQPQRGRRNVNDRGRTPNIRPIPRGRPQSLARRERSARPRGGFVHDQGISLPAHWVPMPPGKTVHTVPLAPGSSEYQHVLRKMQATTGGMQLHVQKIERIQNPHLYQSYMVRKQKMDKDCGGNSEKQLFHGTDGKNVSHINTQGFNRSFCGAHGTKYGYGVYFARDASYSVGYAGGGSRARCMYLARVLVGRYCTGNEGMKVPPPKDPFRPEVLYDSVVNDFGNPSIFVVFFDSQCYPEYLITF